MSLLKIKNLKKYFPIKHSNELVKAVDDVSMEVPENVTVALVGESGSGKTTIGRCILRFIEITDGLITLRDEDISSKSEKEFKKYRKKLQIVFQNPHNALDPRMRVEDIMKEPIMNWDKKSKDFINEKIKTLLNSVNLENDIRHRYPHQLSGGQLQRIALALAISNDPELIVLDEPTSSLDAESTAELIDLLIEMKNRLKNSYIFISHDLHAVKDFSDIVDVMYLGRIVEEGEKNDIFENPKHPYTKALLASMLDFKNKKQHITEITGEIPSPINLPKGCYFYSRCPVSLDVCKDKYPGRTYVKPDHYVHCYYVEKNL